MAWVNDSSWVSAGWRGPAEVGARRSSDTEVQALRQPPTAREGTAESKPDSTLEIRKPWRLPAQGLAVFHGSGDVARLSHYFLPRLLREGRRVLFLDGANGVDPRLMARLARERGIPFAQFNQQIQIARAFTCFQLTELIARLPQFLAGFPAEVLMVTAFPELYFDEDVRDWDARVAFEQGLRDLRRWAGDRSLTPVPPEAGWVRGESAAGPPRAVAVFSAGPSRAGRLPPPARRRFFTLLCAAAAEVWEFRLGNDRRLALACARARQLEAR